MSIDRKRRFVLVFIILAAALFSVLLQGCASGNGQKGGTLKALIDIAKGPSTAALDSFQVLNWKDVPSIPLTLRYSPEEVESLTGKYETRQYVFNQEEWEAWKTPGIDVTFRLNKAGDIEISKCEAFISTPEETTLPKFVATAQNVAIEGSQIRVAIIGYLDYGSYQSNEQTLAFKVRFISILKSLNHQKGKL